MRLKDLKPTDYHIYVDLDGVLANLLKKMKELTGHTLSDDDVRDKAAWKKFHGAIESGDRLFAEFELLPDAHELWNYIQKYNPSILTATGKAFAKEVDEQKREWVKKYFKGYKEIYTVIASGQKAKFAWPDAILIDDRMKSIGPWRDRGGIGIHHTSASNTIAQLRELGL